MLIPLRLDYKSRLNYDMNPNISTLTGSLKSLFFSLDLGLVVHTNEPHRM